MPLITCTADTGAVKLITEGTVLAAADALAVFTVLIRGTRPFTEPTRPARFAFAITIPWVTSEDKIPKQ